MERQGCVSEHWGVRAGPHGWFRRRVEAKAGRVRKVSEERGTGRVQAAVGSPRPKTSLTSPAVLQFPCVALPAGSPAPHAAPRRWRSCRPCRGTPAAAAARGKAGWFTYAQQEEGRGRSRGVGSEQARAAGGLPGAGRQAHLRRRTHTRHKRQARHAAAPQASPPPHSAGTGAAQPAAKPKPSCSRSGAPARCGRGSPECPSAGPGWLHSPAPGCARTPRCSATRLVGREGVEGGREGGQGARKRRMRMRARSSRGAAHAAHNHAAAKIQLPTGPRKTA